MKEEGLWKLFFLTGLPEVYLALGRVRGEHPVLQDEYAIPAFVPRPDEEIES